MAARSAVLFLLAAITSIAHAEPNVLENDLMRVEVDKSGQWSMLDKQSGERWPSEGTASAGSGQWLDDGLVDANADAAHIVLRSKNGATVTFEPVDDGRSLEIRYASPDSLDVHVLKDALAMTNLQQGAIVVPCREGLLIPARNPVAFQHGFGASEYEGCHMNMLGFIKAGSALLLSWDGVDVWPTVERTLHADQPFQQRLTTDVVLHGKTQSLRLTPLGKGDWNTIASGYRRIAETKGLAVTLHEKIRRNAHAEQLLGASNVKLWMCLARYLNDDSTKEEWTKVHWTFDEAAQMAEHLKNDLKIDRCLFILGGWTEGGYDCRHPDALPANPECGGNDALAAAVERIQSLGYLGCFHDNYQDMYRDAKSWDPNLVEKAPDGSLVTGGRWMGGRAYMVCASKQIELAMRPQNLPEIQRLFHPRSYFIDTTFAVPPRCCFDPNHPIDRNKDVALKSELSDKTRDIFGLFGSECGREWALPHSDFFEGMVGVAGTYFHQLKPDTLGAIPIPFWEMVYHDCEACYGKYGYAPQDAAEYVAHHVLCARPLHYHSMPDHLYWKQPVEPTKDDEKNKDPFAHPWTSRSDLGWAAGLHPIDAFLKNTHEILGPLNRVTAHQRLTQLEPLTPDWRLRRAVYGQGADATHVIANFGSSEAEVETHFGNKVKLPKWGFVVESPAIVAFYATQWNGIPYPNGAMFTLQPADGGTLPDAKQVRIFHGFGDPEVQWNGRTHRIERENVVE